MTGLIDSLLMLARVDAGTEPLYFEPLHANQLVSQVAEKWKTSMRLAMLDFRVGTSPEPAMIDADRDSLRRLLTILLDNACRYTPPGGSVTLSVARDDARVSFAVSDTGVGIAPEHQRRIFDRFYRVERNRSGASQGSGLGLALAKWIAERHRVLLTLESAAGQGSSFRFAVPEVAAPQFAIEGN